MPLLRLFVSPKAATRIHITGKSDPVFELIPSECSEIKVRCFSIKKNKENFVITAVRCTEDGDLLYDGTSIFMNYECAVKHMIELHVNYLVKVIFKAPHQSSFNDNGIFKYQLSIPDFEDIKLCTEFKKVCNGSYGVWIDNPYLIKIDGAVQNYSFDLLESEDFSKIVTFEFDPDIVRTQISCHAISREYLERFTKIRGFKTLWSSQDGYKSFHLLDAAAEALKLKSDSNNTSTTKIIPNGLQLDLKYADVIFITSNGESIPSHRCILAPLSPVLDGFFEKCIRLPMTIKIHDVSTEAVKRALDFCYGTTDDIDGYELELLKIAIKLSISNLKAKCISSLEKNLSKDNIYEVAEFAYNNDIERLISVCTKFLDDNGIEC